MPTLTMVWDSSLSVSSWAGHPPTVQVPAVNFPNLPLDPKSQLAKLPVLLIGGL